MAVKPAGNVQGPGEVKDTIGRLSPKGRAVFTTKGWNNALRQAGEAAVGWWLVNYGPLRFKLGYVMSNLPYSPGASKKRRMFRHGEPPFFSEGVLQNNLYMRSKTDVRAKKGGITAMKLLVPIGHYIKAETINAFKSIPPRERAAVAREFRRALIQALQAGRAKAAAKAQAKAERKARAAANKAKREAGRQRAAERKARAAQKRADRRSKTFKPAA